MRKIIAFLFPIFAFLFSADQLPYYSYGTLHMMGGYPLVGIGLRTQKGVNGFDFSASALPYFVQFSNFVFHLKGLYLFRPVGKGLYMGTRLGFLQEPEMVRGISGTWEGTFGLEWQTKNGNMFFLEADVIGPMSNWSIWPGLSFGYGF